MPNEPYLKILPVLLLDLYVGGGDGATTARFAAFCRSRSSKSNLKQYALVKIGEKQSFCFLIKVITIFKLPRLLRPGTNTDLSLYSCMLAWYDGGGGRCWNSGYNKPWGVLPRPLHGRRPPTDSKSPFAPRPRHCCEESGDVIRQAAPLIVTRMMPTPVRKGRERGTFIIICCMLLRVPLMVGKFPPFCAEFMVLGSGPRLFTTNFSRFH